MVKTVLPMQEMDSKVRPRSPGWTVGGVSHNMFSKRLINHTYPGQVGRD